MERILKETVAHAINATIEAHDTHAGGHGHGEHHIPAESSIILLVFTMMFIGGILRFICEHTNIPYSPLLLISGVVLERSLHNNTHFKVGINGMLSIDPHGFLGLLVPIIIFEPGFKSKFRYVKKIRY
jgi:NhaP-type Na+/H+ or K+/H+ antiporter